MNFVPEGEYILRASDAADVEYREVKQPPNYLPFLRIAQTIHKYGSTEKAVHVEGNLLGIVLSVPRRAVPGQVSGLPVQQNPQ